MKDPMKIDQLNSLYQEADQIDQDLFSEQRSNVLLVAGDHYNKRDSTFLNRIRSSKQISSDQKLRLTKNHLQRITKTYINNITSSSPSVSASPKNSTELQDIKSAELHNAVIQDMKDRYKLGQKTNSWAQDYVNIGEVAVKVFFDPSSGQLKGYHQAVGDDGQLSVDEQGQPVSGDEASFSGALVFERIYGFNLLRSPEAKSFDEARCIIIRKMVGIEDLKIRIGEDEEKLKMVDEGKDETYMIFDGARGAYMEAKGQTLLKEFYYRPCLEYPEGYYYIATNNGILWQGVLPYGIFPIAFACFDDVPTSPRGRSIIKQLRPYQAEINRAASKIAEHQITLGDDKIITQMGSKMTQGDQLSGIRGIQVSGAPPTILPGRDGAQYAAYAQSQISEMYQVAMLDEEMMNKSEYQLDSYAMLFRALKQKKKFSLYSDKFEQFLVDAFTIGLDLSRHYLTEEDIIYAVGRRERVNISEFKNSDKLCYQVLVEPMSDDVETKMGKQLTLNHLLQYAGPSMGKEEIGKILKNMPYGNFDESFDDMTIDYENAKNDILNLDRGGQPLPNPTDNHSYLVKRLVNRMKQSDFQHLDPMIKQNYQEYKQMHERMNAEELQKLKASESDFIPISGAMIACDMYVQDPSNQQKAPKRVRVPYQALDWLLKRLEQQGMTLQKMEAMQNSAKVETLDIAKGMPLPSIEEQSQDAGGTSAKPGAEMPKGAVNGVSNAVGYR